MNKVVRRAPNPERYVSIWLLFRAACVDREHILASASEKQRHDRRVSSSGTKGGKKVYCVALTIKQVSAFVDQRRDFKRGTQERRGSVRETVAKAKR